MTSCNNGHQPELGILLLHSAVDLQDTIRLNKLLSELLGLEHQGSRDRNKPIFFCKDYYFFGLEISQKSAENSDLCNDWAWAWSAGEHPLTQPIFRKSFFISTKLGSLYSPESSCFQCL